ncbi:MAG: NUDIX domain-containing protein [Lachnospiraceae bacterium]|nr:NUDIX domain-containing protein [Lachnospiraceae bacterium]
MENNHTNWCQSVTGVVIRDNKVLLARHTYGSGKGKLIIPGGYVEFGETPQEAVKREYLEETSIIVEPRNIIGIRFNAHDWYIAFKADYISGEPTSDHDENSEVIWLDPASFLRPSNLTPLHFRICALYHFSCSITVFAFPCELLCSKTMSLGTAGK